MEQFAMGNLLPMTRDEGVELNRQPYFRSSCPAVFCKKEVLKNFSKCTGKHLCQSLFLIKLRVDAFNFIKKETLAQLFFCEFCKNFENSFFYRTHSMAASAIWQ